MLGATLRAVPAAPRRLGRALLSALKEWRRRDLERWDRACRDERKLYASRVSRSDPFIETRTPFRRP